MNGLVLLAACVCAVTGQLYTPGLPITAPSSQFHAQDEFGQFSFGHSGGPSARTEARNAFGVTTGGYQYIDANGLVQTVQYIADGLGFRVQGTNLPVAPVAAPAPLLVTVGETDEVKAARAAFEAAYAAAAARTQEVVAKEVVEVPAEVVPEVVAEAAVVEVAAVERKKRDAEEEEAVVPAVLPYPYAALGGQGLFAGLPADIVANINTAVPTVPTTYAGLTGFAGVAPYAGLHAGFAGVAPYAGLHAGFAGVAPYAGLHAGFAGVAPYAGLHAAAPLVAAAPLAAAAIPSREAIKTTIKLNPGHAVFYRVD